MQLSSRYFKGGENSMQVEQDGVLREIGRYLSERDC